MRGGAASGVVYPLLAARLARHYRFRTIGGASAGAIAAGVMAAAQYGVLNANPAAFSQTISEIPACLAQLCKGRTRLNTLFSASVGLEPLERLRDGVLKSGIGPGLLFAEVGALLGGWAAVPVLLVSVTLILLLGVALRDSLAVTGPGPFIIALALLAFAAVVTLATILLLLGCHVRRNLFPPDIFGRFRAAGFGICGGTEPERWRAWAKAARAHQEDCREVEAPADHLADWLHGRIQEAASLPLSDPLTMGHLWAGKMPLPDVSAWSRPREIDLVLTTTNLSHQVPHRFPFLEKPGMRLYFCRDELSQVLPKPVVDSMARATYAAQRAHLESGNEDRKAIAQWLTFVAGGKVYWRLPRPEQLPVLLGVRMSLSFPLLLSAVRLHAWRCDDLTSEGETRDQKPFLRPCWFSDGGITSNFPVTMFDSLLPARPTFCINLADLPAGETEASRIELDTKDRRRIAPEWRSDLDSEGLLGLLGSIIDTARNGHENDLMTMPTCRDRIVTIRLDPKREGGLNLDMPPALILQMARYGEEAAETLLAAYAPEGDKLGSAWPGHRRMRLRKSLAALESLLVNFDSGWNQPASDAPSWRLAFEELVNGAIDRPGRRHVARRLLNRWIQLSELVAAATKRPEFSFFDGTRNLRDPTSLNRLGQAPRPRMGLQLAPTGSQDPLRG